MWKPIDQEVISGELKAGHIISDNDSNYKNYRITNIHENGIVTATKTDSTNRPISFPKNDLVDAKWWMLV